MVVITNSRSFVAAVPGQETAAAPATPENATEATMNGRDLNRFMQTTLLRRLQAATERDARRRPTVASPMIPDNSNHAAAGSGTALTLAVTNWVLSPATLSQ